MTNPTQLFLLRHGEVEARYQQVFGGRLDMELSPLGHRQAQLLADYLRPRRLDAIYASPMKRAQQTLAPMASLGRATAVTRPELREVDFGVWTGLEWPEVFAKFHTNPTEWLDQLEQGSIPGAESGAALRARLQPCLREILAQHVGQSVALVCHGGVIRVLLAMLFQLPLARLGSIEIEYASVTRVHLLGERARLHLLNLTPWRDLG